jgi:hypothetical protein
LNGIDVFATTLGGTMVADHSTAPKTISVPDAGRIYFDLCRNASYEAAKRGDLPVVRIGRLLRVPIAALERKLEVA